MGLAFSRELGYLRVAVLALALLPGSLDPVHAWDKAKHFTAFFILSLLAVLSFPRRGLLTIGTALSTFGGAIELAQALPILHQDCSLADWLADTPAVIAELGMFGTQSISQAWHRFTLTELEFASRR